MSGLDRLNQGLRAVEAQPQTVVDSSFKQKSDVQSKVNSLSGKIFNNPSLNLKLKSTITFLSGEMKKNADSISEIRQKIIENPKFQRLQEVPSVFTQQLSQKMLQSFSGSRAKDPNSVQDVTNNIEKDLGKLIAKYPHLDKEFKSKIGDKLKYITPEVREQYNLLSALKEQVANDPEKIKNLMDNYKKDPIYNMLGGMKFLYINAQLDANVKRLGGMSEEEKTLSLMERVSVFAYTTGEYKTINPALRKIDEKLPPGILAMVENVNSAIQKLPKAPVTSQTPVLMRAMKMPETGAKGESFIDKLFGGDISSDRAFSSTTLSQAKSGEIQVTIEPKQDASYFPGALIPKTLTAWGAEEEVLFLAGAEFSVISKELSKDGLTWSITLRCT